MSDIKIVWDIANGRGDIALNGADLLMGDDLSTAVLISLFSDRMAGIDDVIVDGSGNPRGWWGDLDQDYPIGSRLWLLTRAKQTNETLTRAADYCREALKWMTDDAVATAVDIRAWWVRREALGVHIMIKRSTGPDISLQYAWAWQGVAR